MSDKKIENKIIVRINIQEYFQREKLINVFAENGYKVWIEKDKKEDKHFVCVELYHSEIILKENKG